MSIEDQLREELRRTAAGTDPTNPDRPQHVVTRARQAQRARRGAAAAASLAVVAAVAVPVWLSSATGPGAGDGGFAGQGTTQEATQAEAAGPYRAVLDAPGWEAVHVSVNADAQEDGEVSYAGPAGSVDIMWRPAATYEDYYEDRRHITNPPSDGEAVEVLGETGRMWAYSTQDHTVIRPVENGFTLEVRGSGMTEPAFRELLGQLRLVDETEFEAALPEAFATSGERDAVAAGMLDGIEQHTDPLLPPGVARSSITSEENDLYALGADVAGGVACAWLQEYADAHAAGDRAAQRAAVAALSGSRDWPVLQEMRERGEYPQVVWDYADQVASGKVPEGWQDGLGCPR